MLISLHELIQKYGITFKGILHVGAHECEELNDYEKYISRDKILWIEALPLKVIQMKKKYTNLLIEASVISDVIETIPFYISNNVQSSSMLELGLHKEYHPHIHYVHTIYVETKLLKNILPKYNIDYNFLNLDIQGAELKALKSMEEYLPKIDYIYTEVNSDYVYTNCALVNELDEYLAKFGFIRIETKWTEYKWGDAFYIKKSI